jgi:RNA polymerase primary sigma factor
VVDIPLASRFNVNDVNVFQRPIMTTTNRPRPLTSAVHLLRSRAQSLLVQEISFIDHPSLRRSALEDLSTCEFPIHTKEAPSLGLPTYLTPLFRKPLLTRSGETHLFRLMNYCRYRANMLRSQLDPQKPKRRLVEEIEALLARAEESRRTITESNLRLVASIARNLVTRSLDFEELLSEGNLILLGAIDKFDFSRGFRFSTYATHAIQRHLYRVVHRTHRRNSRESSTDELLLASSVAAPAVEADFSEEFPDELRARMLYEVRKGLDSRERRILQARFGLNSSESVSTFQEIAGTMDLSKERIRQLQHRAIDKLRELLGVELDEPIGSKRRSVGNESNDPGVP